VQADGFARHRSDRKTDPGVRACFRRRRDPTPLTDRDHQILASQMVISDRKRVPADSVRWGHGVIARVLEDHLGACFSCLVQADGFAQHRSDRKTDLGAGQPAGVTT